MAGMIDYKDFVETIKANPKLPNDLMKAFELTVLGDIAHSLNEICKSLKAIK